ncbi:spo0e like sporulation regulatory protein [Lucifera butyrica]|uniref:Spo0e like sporulation regulatory protein n=1 Tax=Lucifera butyrica TaxID=1351585 RepID=A0A498R4T8_9FIRM|nr:aspartyl-phosphate phosphatase Spo0E family protein [Lucifera butyrica]VBB05282.1 spo0e like sporulation regulatory protein [Lucifera butyrica]
MDEIQEIERIIEKLRTRLHATAQGKCFTDPEVIRASQELNQMLNQYEKLLSRKCKA